MKSCLFLCIVWFSVFSVSSFGQVRFLPVETYPVDAPVVVADLNGDDKPDLVALKGLSSSALPTVVALLGNGDGTFQAAKTSSLGGFAFPRSLALGDVNGDGKPDLLVAIECRVFDDCRGLVGVMLGNGDGTFQNITTYSSGGMFASSVAVADLNGDGKLDLLVTNSFALANCDHGVVSVLKGNGDGTFQTAESYDSGGCYANLVVAADANDDGNLDLLVVNGCLSYSTCVLGGGVGVLLGNGDGTFRAAQSYSSDRGGAASLAVADLNGDGKLDIAVANECVFCDAGATIAVLLGNGDGTFRTARIFSSGAYLAMSIAIADINLDGKPDLIVAACVPGPARCFGPSGTIFGKGVASVLLGNGDGTFRAAQRFGSGGYLGVSVVVVDVNGDSKPDVLVNNECGSSNPCTGVGNVGILLNATGVFTDTTPPVITLSAAPKILWPPNGKIVPVTVSGTIFDSGSGVNANSAAYSVNDEYGEVQPMGAITLGGPGGNYSFTVLLQASRRGSDLDGRRYTLTVRAKDNAGNGASKTSVVIVPHDQGH